MGERFGLHQTRTEERQYSLPFHRASPVNELNTLPQLKLSLCQWGRSRWEMRILFFMTKRADRPITGVRVSIAVGFATEPFLSIRFNGGPQVW